MKKHRILILIAFFSALTATPAFGAVSYHDLGGAYISQVPPTATTGPTNDGQSGPNGSYALVDHATGTLTGVTLTVSGVVNHSAGAYVTTGDFAILFPDDTVINYNSALFLGTSTHAFAFSGLIAGYTYDIAIYANRAGSGATAERTSSFVLSGASSFTNTSSADGTTISTSTGGPANDTTTLQTGDNPDGYLVRYSNIVPEGDTITIRASGAGYSGNALRFESVPEPATAALTGLGVFGLLLRRRSRHA